MAMSLVLPLPQARSDPPIRALKTMGAEGVAPRVGGDMAVKVASDMRWVLV